MKVLHRIILISTAFIACVVLLELGLRMIGWQRSFARIEVLEEGTPRTLGQVTLKAHRTLRHTANEFDVTYRTNTLGYFDGEWEAAAPDSVLRIAFVGDSFAMGHGVSPEDAFPKRFEALLRERGAYVEVLNFGVWGTGTLHQAEFIPDLCALGVDQVYFCFYVNDLDDNEIYIDHAQIASVEARPGVISRSPSLRIRESMNRHSRAFAFFSERTKNLRDAVGAVTYPLEAVFTGAENVAIDSAAVYLQRACDAATACGIDCAIVYIPTRIQVQDVRVPDTFQLDLPQDRLRAALPRANWIDLTPAFRAAASATDARGEALFLREGHWTPLGHQRVAEWLSGGATP